MIVGAAKSIRWDTKEEDLEPFSGLNLQLAFFPRDFYHIDHSDLKIMLSKMDINPISIHYPSFPSDDVRFIDNLKMLKDSYGLDIFVVHPKFDKRSDAFDYLESKAEEISSLGVKLAYENIPYPKNSWVNDIFSLDFGFPFTRLTYDITHLAEEMNEVAEVDGLLDKTSVVHLSNVKYGEVKKHDHLPIQEGDRDIARFCGYLQRQEYNGQVILEYSSKFNHFVKEDVKFVEGLLL
jgi:sugar phosphate isomerase/epimerase